MSIRLYFLYLARRTLVGVFGLFVVISALIVSVDLIEAMRETEKVGAGFGAALRLTLLRAPQVLLTLSPFVFLFGTLWAYGQMAKSSEVAVMRAAGLSVWRLIAPPALLAVLIGLVTITVLDPAAARMESMAQAYKNELRGLSGQMLPAFREGIWLRQPEGEHAILLRADSYERETSLLRGVTLWRRTQEGVFVDRIDAGLAEARADAFVLGPARLTARDGSIEFLEEGFVLPVALDLRALKEEQVKPGALSVWTLPEVWRILETAGVPTISYRLRYHDLWSLPVKLAAMTLIACAFALGINHRSGGTARLMGVGVIAGFALFILSELSTAIAEAAIVPVGLAAWAPGVLAVLFALSLLLFREDG